MTPGTAFLTLRSDNMDKYAQPDGGVLGKPGISTGISFEGPALKGATNLVLSGVDHRETAVAPEAEVRLSGLVTGTPGGVQNQSSGDRCCGGSVSRVADTGERIGGAIHTSQTGADGRWGQAQVDPSWYLEMV